MNELPDLSPRIQVGLFNILEERDIQIRGFPVRLNLDVQMVFSANPEDYTNRGRIVTPLKDRIGSVVQTHYPLSRELGIQIMEENAWTDRDAGVTVVVPAFMQEIVEETSRLARTSPHVNQASGVSVRMSIANYENLISAAERRGLLLGETVVVPRVSDLAAMIASSLGKLELNMTEEVGQESRLIQRIVDEAVKNVFDTRFKTSQFKNVVEHFEGEKTLEVGDRLPAATVLSRLGEIRDFQRQIDQAAKLLELDPGMVGGKERDALLASVGEFLIEALHCHNRLNKQSRHGKSVFRR